MTAGTGRTALRVLMRVGLLVFAGAIVLAIGATLRVRPDAVTLGAYTFILRHYEGIELQARQQLHEAVHRRQFEREGLVPFLVSYLFDPKQRLAWEAEANAAEVCYARLHYPRAVPIVIEIASAQLRRYAVFGRPPLRATRAAVRAAYEDGRGCDAVAALIPAAWQRWSPLTAGSAGAAAP